MAKADKTTPKKKEYVGFVETPQQQKKFTELVIKEIMVQKNVTRDEAIKTLESHK